MIDKDLALSTLKSLEQLMENAEHLRLLCEQGDYVKLEQLADHILQEINSVMLLPHIHVGGIESIMDSLRRTMVHAKARSSKTLDKIDFELLPLMRVLCNIYYFFNCVYPDKALMEKYYQEEMHVLGSNKYVNNAVKTGEYKYDLSIAVIAFNKLEYTKQCVESILKYTPQDLNYELILINHGSTDGTKEYFESISPTKQLDISINGGGLAAYTSICEGKYFMLLSNDVIVTENAIANMIKCMESDEKIAWVVPVTPNVSNLQTIPAKYNTIDEMHAFASKNNQCSDPYRWEQRTRLVDPISLRRSCVSFSSSGVNWAYYLYTQISGGFSDDKEALLYRRNGYKMILAKDSYCHHFGSITLKDEVSKQESFYDEGRKAFYDAFGIDPWGPGFCWSAELMSLLPCREEGHVNILGLNCGIGSNPLKIKESLKENAHNLDVTLFNVTDDKRYVKDLQGVSDVFAYMRKCCDVQEIFPEIQFNYIVLESGLELYSEPLQMVKELKKRLVKGGFLALQMRHSVLKKNIFSNYRAAATAGDWCVIPEQKHMSHSAYSQYGQDAIFDSSSQKNRQGAEWHPLIDGKMMGGHLDPDVQEVAGITLKNHDRIPGLVSIIIRLSKDLETAIKCLHSIRENTPEPHEITFVVPSAFRKVAKWARQQSRGQKTYLVLEGTGCFTAQVNFALREASGEFIVILSHECIVTEGWLSGMLECLNSAPDVGIVGPMTNRISGPQKVPDADDGSIDRLEEYARSFSERNRGRRTPVKRIVGFCMLFKRELMDKIGLLDERFGSGNFEDDDFCLRATLAGYRNLVAGDVFIHHFGSRSFIGNKINYADALSRNQRIFREKWQGIDPKSSLGMRLLTIQVMERAEELNQKDQMGKAADTLFEGIARFPSERRLYQVLSEILIDSKEFEEALKVLNRMPSEGTDIWKLERAGYCKEGLDQHEEAEEIAELVLSLHPSSSFASNLKGMVAYKRGDKEKAGSLFEKAMALDPGYGEPHTNLGVLKWTLDEKHEALDLLERGFILSPTLSDPVTLYHSAITAAGEFERAERVLREAKTLCPFSRRAAFLLIDVLIQQGKNGVAMSEIEEAMINFGIDDGILSAALAIRDRIEAVTLDPESKETLSLCMIVRDEEENLPRSLMSVKPLVDEMIVVDTGSRDRTKEIARVYGAKVYDYEWADDFSAARNFSLSKATGRWVFILDADETVSPIDHSRLTQLVKEKNAQPVAYSLTTRNYVEPVNISGWTANDGNYREEAGTGWFPGRKVRLFPNDPRIRFEHPVHELVEPSLRKAGIKIKECAVPIHHYGKLSVNKNQKKGEEYFLLGKKKLEERGDDFPSLYELAVQAGELGKYEEAVELWQRCIGLQAENPNAHLNQGYAYLKLGRYEDALVASARAMALAPDLKEAVFNYSLCEFCAGDIEKAISCLEGMMVKEPQYPSAMALLSAAYLIGGNREKGLETLRQMKRMGYDGPASLYAFADRLISAGRRDAAVLLLEGAIETQNMNDQIVTLLAQCKRHEEREDPPQLPT